MQSLGNSGSTFPRGRNYLDLSCSSPSAVGSDCFLSIQSPFPPWVEVLGRHVAAPVKTTYPVSLAIREHHVIIVASGIREVGSFQVLPLTRWICPPLSFFPYLLAEE